MTLLNILLSMKNSNARNSNDVVNKTIDFSFVVAHVNHGLRENANIDEQYVEEYCKKNDIEFYALHANIKEESKKLKRGLEDTGRIIRYKFFDEVM